MVSVEVLPWRTPDVRSHLSKRLRLDGFIIRRQTPETRSENNGRCFRPQKLPASASVASQRRPAKIAFALATARSTASQRFQLRTRGVCRAFFFYQEISTLERTTRPDTEIYQRSGSFFISHLFLISNPSCQTQKSMIFFSGLEATKTDLR